MSEADLASLSLFRATPEQIVESRQRAWLTRSGGLKEKQYLGRDEFMDTLPHAIGTKAIVWVLAPRTEPHTLDFLCSCRTYRRKALCRYPPIDGKQNVLKEEFSYGVASVYTPPEKRGKGYASHMMRLLHWVMAPRNPEFGVSETFPDVWGAPPPEQKGAGDGRFSVLYSDIGGDFYWNCGPGTNRGGGWEVKGNFSTIWDVPKEPEINYDQGIKWTWVQQEDLHRLWEEDADLIKKDILDLPMTSNILVSCLPDEGVAAFQPNRSLFGREEEISIDIFGVKLSGSDTSSDLTFATWSVDMRPLPPTLIVTRIRATEDTFPGLLGKIQEVARRSGIGKIEVWNLPVHLNKVAIDLRGTMVQRVEGLPAIRWYGKESTESIGWIFNEKFCWC
ncbi:hypothetical protein BJ138DRAFT_1143537 [Hygrophoropsis aurantiaca]|uniref:Uncharacterized protein n=1 Tax=Hygrophoropsis aurantiaca TaxID=72124 RepID=A0ACB8ANN5_9AGAM|nr:hypothetical protein BJ138DRAFT_1143537 [Hygrophoropsis aurantiaca]